MAPSQVCVRVCVSTVRRSLLGCDTHFASERRGMSTCIFRAPCDSRCACWEFDCQERACLAAKVKVLLRFAAQPLQFSAGCIEGPCAGPRCGGVLLPKQLKSEQRHDIASVLRKYLTSTMSNSMIEVGFECVTFPQWYILLGD